MRLCRFVLRLSSPAETRLLLLYPPCLSCRATACFVVPSTSRFSSPSPTSSTPPPPPPPGCFFSAQLTEQTRCHRRRRVPAALSRDLLEVEPPGVKCRCSVFLSVRCRDSFAWRMCGSLSPLHSSESGLKRRWVFASHHHLRMSRLGIEAGRLPTLLWQQQQQSNSRMRVMVMMMARCFSFAVMSATGIKKNLKSNN